MTKSTPSISSSGNERPQSTISISPPLSYKYMFLPISPSPPSEIIRSGVLRCWVRRFLLSCFGGFLASFAAWLSARDTAAASAISPCCLRGRRPPCLAPVALDAAAFWRVWQRLGRLGCSHGLGPRLCGVSSGLPLPAGAARAALFFSRALFQVGFFVVVAVLSHNVTLQNHLFIRINLRPAFFTQRWAFFSIRCKNENSLEFHSIIMALYAKQFKKNTS